MRIESQTMTWISTLSTIIGSQGKKEQQATRSVQGVTDGLVRVHGEKIEEEEMVGVGAPDIMENNIGGGILVMEEEVEVVDEEDEEGHEGDRRLTS